MFNNCYLFTKIAILGVKMMKNDKFVYKNSIMLVVLKEYLMYFCTNFI